MRILKNIKTYILLFVLAYIYYFFFRNDFFRLISIPPLDMTYSRIYRLVSLPSMYFNGSVILGYLIKEKYNFNRHLKTVNYLHFISLIVFLTIIITGIAITDSSLYVLMMNSQVGNFIFRMEVYYLELYILLGIITSYGVA